MISCRSHCYWMIDMITSVVEIVACSWKWHCILERRCSLRYRNKELKSVKFEASSRSLEDLEIFFFPQTILFSVLKTCLKELLLYKAKQEIVVDFQISIISFFFFFERNKIIADYINFIYSIMAWKISMISEALLCSLYFPCSYIRHHFQIETKKNILQKRFEYLHLCTI